MAKKNRSMSAYQIKVTLNGSDPKIWRRVLVPSNFHLGKLNHVIQMAMGWQESHLHEFVIENHRYINPDYEPDDIWPGMEKNRDENKLSLQEVVEVTNKFIYRYDFGDGWEHEIKIEKTIDDLGLYHLPICIDGENACPPEDCGGIGGYYQLLESIKDPSSAEGEEMLRWLGGYFNPISFDPNRINRDTLWMKKW